MTELVCAAPRCAIPRRHLPGCENEKCRGCQPARPAPGLNLCDHHATRIAADAVAIAELDHDLEEVLGTWGRQDERTSGSGATGTVVNEAALQCRSDIRAVLSSWVRLVAEERGHQLPPDTLVAIGAYLAANGEWLAAHGAAGECSDELSSLLGRARAVAYPSGARKWTVGPCPAQGCAATISVILRDADSATPSELVCDGEPAHSWPYSQTAWRRLGRQITERYMSAAEVAEAYGKPIGTVYWYANRDKWRRTQDGRRPALYLAEDVRASLDAATSDQA